MQELGTVAQAVVPARGRLKQDGLSPGVQMQPREHTQAQHQTAMHVGDEGFLAQDGNAGSGAGNGGERRAAWAKRSAR